MESGMLNEMIGLPPTIPLLRAGKSPAGVTHTRRDPISDVTLVTAEGGMRRYVTRESMDPCERFTGPSVGFPAGVTSRTMSYRMQKTKIPSHGLDFGHVVAILIVALAMVPFVSAGFLLQP